MKTQVRLYTHRDTDTRAHALLNKKDGFDGQTAAHICPSPHPIPAIWTSKSQTALFPLKHSGPHFINTSTPSLSSVESIAKHVVMVLISDICARIGFCHRERPSGGNMRAEGMHSFVGEPESLQFQPARHLDTAFTACGKHEPTYNAVT